jgi:hypothetical protein
MPTRGRAGNLTAALVLVAALELVVNRLANRLFLPRSLVSGGASAGVGATALARLVSDSGPFLFHLSGMLALMVFALALAGLLRRRELYPEPLTIRLLISVIGIFWLLATLVALIGRVPRGFVVPLEAGFASLSLLTLAAFARSSAPARAKLGVFLFTLPSVLHVIAAVLDGIGWSSGRRPAGSGLGAWSEAALLLAAASAPFTLAARGGGNRRRWVVPLALAALLTAALIAALRARYDLVQAIALYGPHLELPRVGTWIGIGYVLGTLGWSYAVIRLLTEKGGARLAGYGLLLLAIAGYPLGSPVELAVSLVGLLSLSVGQLRLYGAINGAGGSAGPALTRTEWRAWVGGLATAAHDGSAPELGPPEAVVVEEDDLEASRIRAQRRGRAVGIRFLRRRGRIIELEVTVGDAGHLDVSATIERHRNWLARSPEQRLPLPRARTGDPIFDQRFSVHGDAPLHSEAVRREIMRHEDGLFSLWKGTAARYRAASGVAESALVIALVDLLIDLVEAA